MARIVNPAGETDVAPAEDQPVKDVQQTSCCIVGGGPAGMVLAYLLARKGVPVILLEEHKDFDRDFRGDTIHPSTMTIMEELGLIDRLLELPHSRFQSIDVQTPDGPFKAIDFTRLKTRYPYIAMIPQVRFLEFMTEEAKKLAAFRLIMGARVAELVEENGVVGGVRYQSEDGRHEVRATLTVGADGRFSRLRRLAGFQAITTSPPMDVLWFRVPRKPDDTEDMQGSFGRGKGIVMLNRGDFWQVALIIPKGSYRQIHDAGLAALRESFAEIVPQYAGRGEYLQDWKQVSLLSVASDRLVRWYKPGLLMIGDAAHTMSPVGGVGINYAIQDAVVAANVLSEPLKRNRVLLHDLVSVQRQRELPTRIIQALQTFMQERFLTNVLDPTKTFVLPRSVRFVLRIPVISTIPVRLVAFGIRQVHVE